MIDLFDLTHISGKFIPSRFGAHDKEQKGIAHGLR